MKRKTTFRRIFRSTRRGLPGMAVAFGLALGILAASADDYGLMHGNGAAEGSAHTALWGMALMCVGALCIRIREVRR